MMNYKRVSDYVKQNSVVWLSALLLVAALLFQPATADAAVLAEGVYSDGISWTLSKKGVLTISGEGKIPAGDEYPWAEYGASVTSISVETGITRIPNMAFYAFTEVKTATLPEGLDRIDKYAFAYCFSLETVNIPTTVTYIGGSAFEYCSALTSIELPAGVTNLRSRLFLNCSSLAKVTIKGKITTIGEDAFASCSTLSKLTLPDSLTKVGERSFYKCEALTALSLPNIKTIPADLCYDCAALETVTLPAGVTGEIGSYAFARCGQLPAITIPAGVTAIGDLAFSGCGKLTAITIPASVSVIGDMAFAGCTTITKVTIPEGVTKLGAGAFSGCTGLADVILPESLERVYADTFTETPWYKDLPKTGIVVIGKTLMSCPTSTAGKVTVDRDIRWIAENAFYTCTKITEVVLPDGLEEIDGYAFRNCETLTKINLPEGLTAIGDYAFNRCYELTKIDLPASLKELGSCVFSRCYKLERLVIPDGITAIGEYLCYMNECLTSVTIPESVTSIANDAFGTCTALKSIQLPAGLTAIRDCCFKNCTSLTEITLPEGICMIEPNAFTGDTALKLVRFTGDAPMIDYTAFTGVTADMEYLCSKKDWDTSVLTNYGGSLTWTCTHGTLMLQGRKDATYTADGHTGNQICSACGTVMKQGSVIPMLVPEAVKLSALSRTSRGIKVSWKLSEHVDIYLLQRKIGKDGTWRNLKLFYSESTTSYTDTNIATGKCYYYRLRGLVSTDGSVSGVVNQTAYSASKCIIAVKAPAELSAANVSGGVKLSWKAVSGASGYRVYRLKDGKMTLIKTLSGANTLTYTDQSVKTGNQYTYEVKAYVKSGDLKYCSVATAQVKVRYLSRPSISKAESTAKGKLTVTWSERSYVTGYQLKYTIGNTTKTLTIKGSDTCRKTITGLKAGASCKVYVRSYKTSGGVTAYSAWSSSKTVKIKE